MTNTAKNIENLGFQPEKINALNHFLDETYVQSGKLSGCGYMLARAGESYHYCAGNGALEESDPYNHTLTADSIFRIFSMTKPITSFVFMQFIEQGLLRFEDKVKDYIPAFANPQVWVEGNTSDYTTRPAARDITLLDLITHQSGMTYNFFGEHPLDAIYRRKQIHGMRNSDTDLAGFCDKLAALPILFSPGEAWHYSFSIDVIGRVLEIVSGLSLDALMHKMVFQPLKMDSTGFNLPENAISRLTYNYYQDPKNNKIRVVDGVRNSLYLTKAHFLGGGGGLYSTLNDYRRFCDMLLNKGSLNGIQLAKAETVEKMMQNQLYHGDTLEGYAQGAFSENGSEGNGFGIGGSVVMDATRTFNTTTNDSFSWGGLANTYFWIDRQNQFSFIFMTQMMPYGCYPIRKELSDKIYEALLP